jgi:hypothetical protein
MFERSPEPVVPVAHRRAHVVWPERDVEYETIGRRYGDPFERRRPEDAIGCNQWKRYVLRSVVPAEFDSPVSGRGERIRAETPSPSLLIPVANIPSYVGRVWKTA